MGQRLAWFTLWSTHDFSADCSPHMFQHVPPTFQQICVFLTSNPAFLLLTGFHLAETMLQKESKHVNCKAGFLVFLFSASWKIQRRKRKDHIQDEYVEVEPAAVRDILRCVWGTRHQYFSQSHPSRSGVGSAESLGG